MISKILPKDLPAYRSKTPSLRLNIKGTFDVNKRGADLIGLSKKDPNVLFFNDEIGGKKVYYIGKPKDTDKQSFEFRPRKSGGFIMNASGLVTRFIEDLQLCIAPDKKSSVRLDISTKPIERLGYTLYQIY